MNSTGHDEDHPSNASSRVVRARAALRKVRDEPETEALVAPASIAFIAALVDQFARRGPAKRRTLHVQGAPVTVLAIEIDLPLRKGGGQKPLRSALAEP